MIPKELLIAAKNKIADPKCWIQKDYARDKDGYCCSSHNPKAVCWCSVGSLLSFREFAYTSAYIVLSKYMHPGIADFNDSHTHEEVLQAFDKAISSI